MDLYEAIEKRYSVRAYEDRAIEEDKLNRVLDAGRRAPSAGNRQEWRFVVVRDAARRKAVAEAADQPFLAQAAAVIAVVSTLDRTMSCGIPAGPVDCAIAIDHMTLAAVAEGLGTCWIGHFDQDKSRRVFGVPETMEIVELLPMGYPGVAPHPKTRKSLEEVVNHEQFAL